VEDANDRALRSSQAWTDGASRFLKDYVAESNDAATATERAFANAFSGAEDSLVGFISSGKLEFRGLADSILADLARMTVRQTVTAPLAGALQSAFTGGGLFGLFHDGGIVGERAAAVHYADAAVFEHARRYHGGGFAGSGLLPDEVPIIARRGELVVPPERVVRDEKSAREQRLITVVISVADYLAACRAPARSRSWAACTWGSPGPSTRHYRLDQNRPGHRRGRGRDLRDHGRLVEPRPAALVFSPELEPMHARIEALEQLNRDTRLLVLDQAWWRAHPLGMLWPEMDAAFATSGGGNGGPADRGATAPLARWITANLVFDQLRRRQPQLEGRRTHRRPLGENGDVQPSVSAARAGG